MAKKTPNIYTHIYSIIYKLLDNILTVSQSHMGGGGVSGPMRIGLRKHRYTHRHTYTPALQKPRFARLIKCVYNGHHIFFFFFLIIYVRKLF